MAEKILRRPEVLKKTGLSNSTLHRLEKSGEFVGRRRISVGIVGWLESEVDAWVAGTKPVSSETQLPAPVMRRGQKSKA